MLLAVDVGNTNITLGVYKGEELIGTFRMTSKQSRTSDEYGIVICEILERRGIPVKEDRGSDYCVCCAGCDVFTDKWNR